jgi:hypothetical protein
MRAEAPENGYERLSVAKLTAAGHLQNVFERQPVNLEDLVLFRARRQGSQLRREEQMNDFCQNARELR